MSRYFGYNFQVKYRIEVILKSLESYLKIIQIIVKYDFPNSDRRNAKITPQDRNTILDESYSDLD
jgi:hypothetical protein